MRNQLGAPGLRTHPALLSERSSIHLDRVHARTAKCVVYHADRESHYLGATDADGHLKGKKR
eukprot:1247852-Alexandrium_andersonii.AAC.1